MKDTLTSALCGVIADAVSGALAQHHVTCRCLYAETTHKEVVEPSGDDFEGFAPIMSPAMLAAALPETAEKTLQKWRSANLGPTWSKQAGTGKVYYLRSSVIEWLKHRAQ